MQPGQIYNSSFFEDQPRASRSSAAIVVPVIDDIVHPDSVLDVGCGAGTWLAEWLNLGVTDILGVDGDYVEEKVLQIESAKFIPADLRQPLSLDRKFDLVQSLETAEHLDWKYADLFVESLVNHGDVILFSAAIPGQGGTGHVNEQPHSYWTEKFAQAGFKMYDIIRSRIQDPGVEWWYRQNIFLYSRDRVFEGSHVNEKSTLYWRNGLPGKQSR